MHQPCISVDTEGQQEGAGNGGSPNWVEHVKLKISEEGESHLSSLSSNLQRFDPKAQRPSIFIPRRQVAVAVPTVAQTPPLDPTGATATATSRWSTGGNPIVAAVGPYHQPARESREPSLITHAKKCAIVKFLARFRLDTGAFLKWAWEKYADASKYYEASSITMGPEELAEMFLLDGCLVLFAVFVLRKPSVQPYPLCLVKDISLSNSARTRSGKTKLAQDFINLSADISQHMKQIRLDLLLLGNQIPFFVLTDLHTRLKETFFEGIELEFQDLALSCFEDIRPSPNANTNPRLKFPDPIHHLLHIFHWSRVPRGKHFIDPCAPLRGEPEANLPCATWFKDSRIKLSKQQAAPGTLHMAFQRNLVGARGVLRVPALHIHNYSDLVFHNLIAFEQGHLNCGLAVTTYCICMARLLQSEADARLLRKKGILAHTHETDQEIVDLFRGIADEHRHASYSKDLLQLCKDVDEHHHSTAARAAKWVVLQCFPRQTVTFFVLLGALISIATLINTIVSVYRFYHPYKQETG